MQVSSYVHSVAEKFQLYYVTLIYMYSNYAYEVVSAQTLTKLLLKLLGRFGRVCTRAGGKLGWNQHAVCGFGMFQFQPDLITAWTNYTWIPGFSPFFIYGNPKEWHWISCLRRRSQHAGSWIRGCRDTAWRGSRGGDCQVLFAERNWIILDLNVCTALLLFWLHLASFSHDSAWIGASNGHDDHVAMPDESRILQLPQAASETMRHASKASTIKLRIPAKFDPFISLPSAPECRCINSGWAKRPPILGRRHLHQWPLGQWIGDHLLRSRSS